MTSLAEQARAERQTLEDDLAALAAQALAQFLVAVESEARTAIPAALAAAALPGRFGLTSVRSAWQRIVAPLKTVLTSDTADDAYDQAAAAIGSSKSRAAAERALSKALSYESSEHWQAVVARQARTAATRQFAQRQLARLQQQGHRSKRWDADLDNATRPAHREADGQTQPLHAAFTVGGFPMMYPGDPSAPLDLTENCRCVLVPASS